MPAGNAVDNVGIKMGVAQGWISPLMKQCFVTIGVSLNVASLGFVCGYGAPLLQQLNQSCSDIPIDVSSGSWLGMWGGVNIITVYPVEFLHRTAGAEANIHLATVSLDVQRLLTNTVAVLIIKKVRRRVMMFSTIGINAAALFAIAGYSYAKEHYCLPFDHPLIGILLAHCMMFAIAMGSLSLSFIIAGEIFPLEFKTLAGGISVMFYSLNLFLAIKTVPYLLATVGVHGMCALVGVVMCYCVAVAGYLLPETKDRTLQEIEDVFRGRPFTDVKPDAKCNTTPV